MAVNLATVAKQKKIKYFLISFVDFFGVSTTGFVATTSGSPSVIGSCGAAFLAAGFLFAII